MAAARAFEYEEDFTSLGRWLNRPPDRAEWLAADGAFHGIWLAFHNALIFDRPLAGDTGLDVRFRFLPMDWDRVPDFGARAGDSGTSVDKYRRSLPPEGAMNFNILYKASGPSGEDLLDAYDAWVGKGKMGLQHFRTYFFTLTYAWARMRRCPGYQLLSDRQDVRSRLNHTFCARIAQKGGRFRYWLDGDLVHDVMDPEAHTSGYVGFVLSASQVEITHFAVTSEA